MTKFINIYGIRNINATVKMRVKHVYEVIEKDIEIDFNEPFCGVGINTACMVANGNVYPCPGWQGYVCGNLNEKSLNDIWFNSKEIKYLRNLKKGDMKKCATCTNKAFCSPCLGRFANESPTGNPLEVATKFVDDYLLLTDGYWLEFEESKNVVLCHTDVHDYTIYLYQPIHRGEVTDFYAVSGYNYYETDENGKENLRHYHVGEDPWASLHIKPTE